MNLITKIQEKLESYKIINPLEYIRIIERQDVITTGVTNNCNVNDLTLYFNNNIFFSIYLNAKDPNSIKDTYISIGSVIPPTSKYIKPEEFNFLAPIDSNNFKILDDMMNNELVKYKNIYDMYIDNKEVKYVIDQLCYVLDILVIDNEDKSIRIKM